MLSERDGHIEEARIASGRNISPTRRWRKRRGHVRISDITHIHRGNRQIRNTDSGRAITKLFEYRERLRACKWIDSRAENERWINRYQVPTILIVGNLPRLSLGKRLGIGIRLVLQ